MVPRSFSADSKDNNGQFGKTTSSRSIVLLALEEETEDETTSGGGWRSGGATSTSAGAGEGGSEDCLETFRVGLEAGGGGSDGGDNKESSAAIPYSRDMVILFVLSPGLSAVPNLLELPMASGRRSCRRPI